VNGTITIPLWLLALLVIVVIALLLIVWSVKRRRRPSLETEDDDATSLQPMLSGLLQSTVVGGNRVELIQNGDYFTRLLAEL
jgi:cardiolipin synthase